MMNRYQMLIQRQQRFFREVNTGSIAYRVNALRKLKQAIIQFEPLIMEALNADLNKSELEAYSTEIGIVIEELNISIRNIKRWTKPKRVKTPLTHLGSSSYVHPQPYGITLIIAPWNYPFQLAIAPLVGAIAAGNCVVIKPSELAPHTSSIIHKLITATFDEQHVAVVEGGIEVNQALLAERWDYIFFTGSVPVGKIVMEAAAKHLTPITLELGGKSPCIIHNDANIKLAAKRVAWGKFINAGQTCVAPDYVYVHRDVREQFVAAFREAVTLLYGHNVLHNSSFTRMISSRHFNRLTSFLQDGRIVLGGGYDENKLLIEPTLLDQLDWDAPIMQEEIFGPLLPMMVYDELTEVIDAVQHHANPLALYLFSENHDVQRQVTEQISFGGGCINDTVFHTANPYLPFGGIGTSGVGSYHGKHSFDTFTHYKGVLKQTTAFDLPFRYPTMKNGLKIIKMFFK
jgi:aldehyde dehydrogenase (NAD+)